MELLYKRGSSLRAHTWKDIGGICGLLLNTAVFAFLLVISGFVVLFGTIIVILSYLCHPLLDLLSLCPASKGKFVDDTIRLEDGTLATRPTARAATLKIRPFVVGTNLTDRTAPASIV